MSPSVPSSILLGKDSSGSAGRCAWKEATRCSPFLSVVQLKGCSPCILLNIRNAVLSHPDISCAKGCLTFIGQGPGRFQLHMTRLGVSPQTFLLKNFYLK